MTAQPPPPYAPAASEPQQYYPPPADQAAAHGSRVATRDGVASEMHRWGRLTGVFSIIALMIWLLLDTVPSVNPALAAVKSTFLWPGVILAILAAIGLIGGFAIQLLAERLR